MDRAFTALQADFISAGYFDEIQIATTDEGVTTTALQNSTEEEQFETETAA